MTVRVSKRVQGRSHSAGTVLTVITVLTALVTSPSTVVADVRTEARSHFRRGMALIAEDQIDEGVSELQRAYDILPHPNVLYNIGRAYVDAERYEEAIEYFEQYLVGDPTDRDEVQDLIASLEARIRPADAQVAAATPEATEGADVTPPRVLDETATQILALADSTDDQEMAERLRAVAAELRADPAREGSAAMSTEGTSATEPSASSAGVEAESTLASRETQTVSERQDIYEEQVFSASRAAESPLDAPNSTTTITAQDIRLSGSLRIAPILRRAAGVAYFESSPGNSQLSIRGLNRRNSNRVISLVDGRSVYLDFLGASIYQFLPLTPLDIQRVEIIRGPASAIYGADAMSGVINMITYQLGDAPSYGMVAIGSNNQRFAAASMDARAGALRGRIRGGYHSADQYSRAIGPDRVDLSASGDDPDVGLRHFYVNGELEYRFDQGYSFRGGLSTSSNDIELLGTGRTTQIRAEDALYTNAYAQFQTPWGLWTRVFWNRLSVDILDPSEQDGGLEIAERSSLDRADVIDAEVVYRGEFDVFGFQNRLISGISYRFKEVDWTWQAQTQTQHHGALFIQDTLRFDDVALLTLSARGDLHPLVGPQVSPHGSFIIHPTPGQTIRVIGGAAFRSPTFLESYLDVLLTTPLRGVSAEGLGNPSLSPERLISVELGYMNEMADFMSLEFAGYFNVVFDLVGVGSTSYRINQFSSPTPAVAFDPEAQAYPVSIATFVNDSQQFKQLGGEASLRLYPVEGLDMYANYAIHETSPMAGPVGALDNDQRTSAHVVNAGVQYRAPFGLDVSADFSWQSDQKWAFPVIDPVRGSIYRLFPLRAYTVLNARIGYRLFNDQLEVAVVGTNLVDEGHREHPYGQPVDRRFLVTATVRY